MAYISLIFIILFLINPQLAMAQVSIYSVNEPPANYLQADGTQTGYVLDIVQALQKYIGAENEILFVPEVRALELARSEANIVLFSFSRTPDRETKFHWIGKVMEKTWRVFALTSSQISVNRIEDLKAIKRIGVVRGDVRQQWMSKRGFTNLVLASEHQQNLALLLRGRVDAIVHESHSIAFLLKNDKQSRTQLKPLFSINKSDVYIVMSKASDDKLVKQWRSGFAYLKANKRIAEIAKRWRQKISLDLGVGATLQDGILVF